LLQQLKETLGILSPVLRMKNGNFNLNVGSLPLAGLLKADRFIKSNLCLNGKLNSGLWSL
jgi:hypothetical protein